MTVRLAGEHDGVSAAEVARRTTFVVESDSVESDTGRDPGDVVVRTRFVTPDRVVAEPAQPLGDKEIHALVQEIAWWSPQVVTVSVGGQDISLPDALPWRRMVLSALTIGQLTVSAPKVAAARAWVTEPDAVVLSVCRVGGELMVLDGHSRAVAAYVEGVAEVGVVEEEAAPLQHETRRWCREAGLVIVADLAGRIVPAEEHRRLWVDRCQAWLATGAP